MYVYRHRVVVCVCLASRSSVSRPLLPGALSRLSPKQREEEEEEDKEKHEGSSLRACSSSCARTTSPSCYPRALISPRGHVSSRLPLHSELVTGKRQHRPRTRSFFFWCVACLLPPSSEPFASTSRRAFDSFSPSSSCFKGHRLPRDQTPSGIHQRDISQCSYPAGVNFCVSLQVSGDNSLIRIPLLLDQERRRERESVLQTRLPASSD